MIHHGVPLGMVLRHDVRGRGHRHVHVVISAQGDLWSPSLHAVACRGAWAGHVHRVRLLHVDDLSEKQRRCYRSIISIYRILYIELDYIESFSHFFTPVVVVAPAPARSQAQRPQAGDAMRKASQLALSHRLAW